MGGKSLDQSPDVVTDVEFAAILKRINSILSSTDLKTMSPRHIEFVHLVETERNYTSILMMIVKVWNHHSEFNFTFVTSSVLIITLISMQNFKEPCENEGQSGGRILDTQEVKTIFGPILPIYSLHRKMLRDLFRLLENWNEDNLIGKIFVDYVRSLATNILHFDLSFQILIFVTQNFRQKI